MVLYGASHEFSKGLSDKSARLPNRVTLPLIGQSQAT